MRTKGSVTSIDPNRWTTFRFIEEEKNLSKSLSIQKKYKSHDIDILLQPDERAVNLFHEVHTNLLYSLIDEAKHLSGLSVSFRLQCTYFEN